jgi:hypothetical protein
VAPTRSCVYTYAVSKVKLPIGRLKFGGNAIVEALNGVSQRLDRLIKLTEQTNDLLRSSVVEHPGRGQPARPGDTERKAVRHASRAPSRRRTQAEGVRSPPPRGPGLHDAIEEVLREAQGPLTASEIATRITDRGLFIPPRSGKPLTSSQVNSRISNLHYRGRFRRVDGRITLARD